VKCIRKGFRAAVARAGLPSKITPHVLRHTVLTWLDEDGNNVHGSTS
jgi:integrase